MHREEWAVHVAYKLAVSPTHSCIQRPFLQAAHARRTRQVFSTENVTAEALNHVTISADRRDSHTTTPHLT